MSNSIGDLKNSGLQGNNWPWQYKVLLGLDKIASLLIAGTEYEAQLVTETCTGPPVTSRILLEVRVWNTDTGTWGPTTYYLPGSSTPVTIGAGCTVAYVDSSAILAQILNVLQDIENGVPEALGQTTMANSMPVTIASNQTSLPVTIDCTDKISLCVNGNTVDALNPLPTTATVSFPTGSLTTCNDAVAITFCDTLLAEFIDQGNTLTTIEGNTSASAISLLNILAELQGTIDVNVTNTVTVQATALDIRPLDCTTDTINICDGVDSLDINADGSINTNITNTSLTVGTTGASSAPVGMYGSTDGGTNWTAVQVDSFGAISTNTNLLGPTGVQLDCDDAISTALCQTQEDILTDIQTSVAPLTSVTPNIFISSGDASFTVGVDVYSITFFNNGTVDVNVSMDGGTTNALIPAGVTITMEAGGIKNKYPANTFVVGSTIAAGASMIVTYNS